VRYSRKSISKTPTAYTCTHTSDSPRTHANHVQVDVIVLKTLPRACDGNQLCRSFVSALQVAYCAAVFVGWPLILVPPVRITEVRMSTNDHIWQ